MAFRGRDTLGAVLAGTVACVAATAALIPMERHLAERREALAAARWSYAEALGDARSRLVSQVRQAVEDQALQQNLDWNLTHSVTAALAARLTPGELDQLTIVDEEKGAKARFSWAQDADGTPLLRLRLPLSRSNPEAPTKALAGAVRLDKNWLALHPALRGALRRSGAEIGAASKQALWRDGYLPGGEAIASLNPKGRLDTLLAKDLSRHRRASAATPGLWLAALGALAAAAGVRKQKAVYEEKAKAAAEESAKLKEQSEALWSARRELKATEAQRAEAALEVEALTRKLAGRAALGSLATQVEAAGPALGDRLEALGEAAHALTGLTRAQLGTDVAALEALIAAWRQGVRERGARKFLRGLSETEGKRAEQSALDEQLAELEDLASRIADVAAASAAGSEAMREAAVEAADVGEAWGLLAAHARELATAADQGTTPVRKAAAKDRRGAWVGALADASSILRLDARREQVVPLAIPEGDALPDVPRAALASALYHFYAAAAAPETEDVEWGRGERPGAAAAAGRTPAFAQRLRREGPQSRLVLRLAEDRPVAPGSAADRALAHHLELARTILAPYGVGVARLPTRDGTAPVALSWAHQEG